MSQLAYLVGGRADGTLIELPSELRVFATLEAPEFMPVRDFRNPDAFVMPRRVDYAPAVWGGFLWYVQS